ncbi:MAG: SbcC/MukB-like Walker B domain-containing protein, partial [Ornithinibacter sp.]
RVRTTRRSLAPLSIEAPDDVDVATVAAALNSHDDTVLAMRREVEDAATRSARATELKARVDALDTEHAEVTASLATAEHEGRDLADEVETLAAGAASVPELTLRIEAARDAVERLDVADAAFARVAELLPVRDALRSTALDRRQELLDLRQRRLDDMAGELARSLADGVPCPVCGSGEHPAPAISVDPVGPEHLLAAESRLAEADGAHQAVHDEAEAHRHRGETLRATLGDTDRTTAEAAVVELTTALESARECAARHEVAVARQVSHTEQVAALRRRLAAVTAQQESTRDAITGLEIEESAGRERLTDLTSAHAACPCASAGAKEHARAGGLLRDLQTAVDDLTAAHRRADAVDADLSSALFEAGFEDADQARAAVVARAELDDERALVTAYRERVAAARSAAEDAAVRSALATEAPDLPALVETARSARETLLAARTAQDDAQRTHRALERLVPVVEGAAAAVMSAATRDARVREMADTTSGSGPENTLRMRLTSFVLAARLEKVAALANERLAVMGGGRYALEHSDHLAARGARSGLGLRVLDQWTGSTRDTATLSGGESFMASLALALGLADAVREEAGGLDLGTLFIDEGFGTLDDDSLEQVITVLDGLRAGGRAVGVVSHVADLRARVTHQAVVHKGAAGSTVDIRTGVASVPAA